jgi:hypothetical protein
VLVEIEDQQAVTLHDVEPARPDEFARPCAHPSNVTDVAPGGIVNSDLSGSRGENHEVAIAESLHRFNAEELILWIVLQAGADIENR